MSPALSIPSKRNFDQESSAYSFTLLFFPTALPHPRFTLLMTGKVSCRVALGECISVLVFFLYYPYLRNAKCVGPFHFLIQPLAWGIVATVFGVGTGSSRNIPGSHLYVGQVNHTQRRQ